MAPRRSTRPPAATLPPERCPRCGSVRALCSRDATGHCDDLTQLTLRVMGPGVLQSAAFRRP